MPLHLINLQAFGFQGQTFNMPLPPRLLLTGRNGSGKTTRLRAIRIALEGAGKEGLLPYATSDRPSVAVAFDNGTAVTRAARIRRNAQGEVESVANSSDMTPSLGERTEAAIAERMAREVAPNTIALEIDAMMSLSPKERRRALLDALGAGGQNADQVLRDLDQRLPDNACWQRLRKALQTVLRGDAIEVLGKIELAAKAAASAARQSKKTLEALASAPRPPRPAGDPAELERERLEAIREIGDLERAHERQMATLREVQGLEADRARLLAGLPEGARKLWPDPESAAAVRSALAAARFARQDAEKALPALRTEAKTADKGASAAASAAARIEGQAKALEALAEASMAGACPACGAPGYDPTALQSRLAVLRKEWTAAKAGHKTATAVATKAATARDKAEDALRAAQSAETAATAAERDLVTLGDVEKRLAAARASAEASDPAQIEAARGRMHELEAALAAHERHRGAEQALAGTRKQIEAAETERVEAERLQELAGPAGLQGDLLSRCLGPVNEAMTAAWPYGGSLAWQLADARGNPDAILVCCRETPDGAIAIPLPSLSGGERASALAAFVVALARVRRSETNVALIEAGEVDATTLRVLLDRLEDEALANVVVATHIKPELPDCSTFEVVRL